MSLKTLTSILKSGNRALEEKLHNLLTEDCSILEYTDDSVLFQKNNYLVLAKFKHNLSESKMTAEDILDNEVIYVSAKQTDKELKEQVIKLIDNLVEEDYVSAEDDLNKFCEEFYQYQLLKRRFPETFTENLIKKAPGFKLRKSGNSLINEFKSDIFSLVTLSEAEDLDLSDYTSIIESCGPVLFLGKDKVVSIIEDALLGNKERSESITEKLFETAKTLNEVNEDIKQAMDNDYSLDDGKFPSEDSDSVSDEDYNSPEDIETDFPDDEGKKDFEEFSPENLSDEEVKQLHKDILTSILDGMSSFVSREANNSENLNISADLDDRLKTDLDILNKPDLADDELSDIEARWNPIISTFLDSDLYTPEQDLGAEEVELKADDGGENPESVEEPENTPEDQGVPGVEPQTLPGYEETQEKQGPGI
jgi:hypothetical protein